MFNLSEWNSDSNASSLPTDEVSIETWTADESTHAWFLFEEVPDKDENYSSPALFVIMRLGEMYGKSWFTWLARSCVLYGSVA